MGKPRIMVVDESESRSLELRLMFQSLGYDVVAEVTNPVDIYDRVALLRPDVIVIDTDSPSRDTLDHVALLSERDPRPIVMFSQDRDATTIRAATRAGASAYVVDGIDAARVVPIIEAAVARFEAYQAVRDELVQTKTRLSERKAIDRAKGILMKARGITEDEAYAALRRMSMERGKRLGEVAKLVVDVVDVLI